LRERLRRPIARPADATMLLKNGSCNVAATVSPNGKWIAYASNVAGRPEVYVERYPELGNRQSI
jgi:Tol biopolymer transport system component